VFGDEARAGRSFVAVILDLTMPGSLGGVEVLAQIRQVEPSIPVFVASGYADDPVMASPRSYGFTDSISKPFRRQELAELFDRHLGQREPAH
jgi:CheY-like chemotaxis protein